MRKVILVLFSLILLSSCFAVHQSEEPSAFSFEERIMKKRILKCKNVVDVVIKSRQDVTDCRARIYVKLTNDRYLEFNHVKYGFKYKMNNYNLQIKQIGNIIPCCISYETVRGSINDPNYHFDVLNNKSVCLSDITQLFPKIQDLEDIVNNYDSLYEFMKKLSDFPKEEFRSQSYELYERDLNLQDWNSYQSDYSYYNGFDYSYNKLFKFFVTDYNDWYSQNNPEFTKKQNYFERVAE